jgi:hypothetical protein
MRKQVTRRELHEAVRRLSYAAQRPLSLDMAYGGCRVENERCGDFLNTGYVPKRRLLETIDAVLAFDRNRSRL